MLPNRQQLTTGQSAIDVIDASACATVSSFGRKSRMPYQSGRRFIWQTSVKRHETGPILSRAVETAGLVFTCGVVAKNFDLDIKGQTQEVLSEIDRLLKLSGSDKSKVLSATIWVPDIRTPCTYSTKYGQPGSIPRTYLLAPASKPSSRNTGHSWKLPLWQRNNRSVLPRAAERRSHLSCHLWSKLIVCPSRTWGCANAGI